MDKGKLGEEAYRKAFEYELQFGCCPQCVLTTIKETVGHVTDDTIKASHGLSGGGGLMGQGACGALTGGLLALSCKRGRDRDKFDKGRFIGNFQAGRKLVEKFQQEFGGITCEELQKQFTGRTYDMWDAEQYQQFDRDRKYQCANATGMVTRWVVEMMA